MVIKAEYTVNLLMGNNGVSIWLFVSKNGQVVFEQAGIKTPTEAMKFATAIIESEEKDEATRQEAEEAQIASDLDGG